MKKWFLLLLMFLSAASTVSAEKTPPLYVFAAASLTDVLREVGRDFQAAYDTKVFFNFAGSNTLRVQIEMGAPADVFIAADLQTMERLIDKELVDRKDTRNLLQNSLVAATRMKNPQEVHSLTELLEKIKPGEYLSLADPETVPEGIYAKQALVNAGLWDKIAAFVLPALDARAALVQVENGNAPFGIVYKTDAAASARLRVVYEIPREFHENIVYPGCIIKNTQNRQSAGIFMEFLRTEHSRQIFTKYGFETL